MEDSQESFTDLRSKVKDREFRKGYKWRIPFLIIAIFQDMTTSGIVFGWAALLSILHDEKVYHNVCVDSDDPDTCSAQDIRLNVIFTVGSITVQLAPLLFGPVFDKFGPKISTMLSSFCIFLGSLLFAFSSPTFDAYIPGFALIGLGASAQHFAIQHISNLFPGKESTIVSIFGGCWGLSSLIFTIFLRLSISYHFSLYNLFSSYSIIAVLVFMSSSICWPMHPYTNPMPKPETINEDETTSLLNKQQQEKLPRGLSYSLENKTLKEQILSFEFLYFIPFFMLGFLICNIYIGTVDDQLSKMGDDKDVYKNIYYWVNAFGWVTIPLIGWILDKQGFVIGFAVNAISAALFLILVSIKLLPLQVLSFAMMAFFNNLLATTMYSYLAQMFGYANFGRLLAVYSTVSAATQFTQPPILALTLGPFHGQYSYTNLLLLIIWVPMFIYPIGLFRKSRKNMSSSSLLLK